MRPIRIGDWVQHVQGGGPLGVAVRIDPPYIDVKMFHANAVYRMELDAIESCESSLYAREYMGTFAVDPVPPLQSDNRFFRLERPRYTVGAILNIDPEPEADPRPVEVRRFANLDLDDDGE